MGLLLYHTFLRLYSLGIRVASLWSPKARLWLSGRTIPLPQFTNKTIWFHCASLGEFEQGRPLLEAIKKLYPQYPVVLTFFSPSGYEIRKNYSLAEKVLYLPLDGSSRSTTFIKHINPAIVLWIKYEFWYYYLKELHSKQIPVLLVSAIFRPSQPFFKFYGKFWKRMLANFHQLFVQDKSSKELLAQINLLEKVTISGDTRFDRVIEITQQLKSLPEIEAFCLNNQVIVAGSTWEEDEEIWKHYTKKHPEIKFIIAPHEVDENNIREVLKRFPSACLYSELFKEKAGCNILIINNIGLLNKLYAYAHITYIGGGFRDSGIHNTLEAAAYSKPVIFGPVYEKFREAVQLIKCGGAVSIQSALELESVLDELWKNSNDREKMGNNSGTFVHQNTGATQTILHYIQENRLLIN
ncbi:MAG: 3-deoxy-D-manno-octulosonic acid transferase [Ferruginibacter sp.]|nr:3-deoxy-D-manno-octulosonic acid transferase [Ferruginibacter sp.]